MNGPQSERIRKEIIKLFKDKFNLRITIQTKLKIVNFFDVTFNLTSQIYQPYSKPVHINVASNHPPNIIRCLPTWHDRKWIHRTVNIWQKTTQKYQVKIREKSYGLTHRIAWMWRQMSPKYFSELSTKTSLNHTDSTRSSIEITWRLAAVAFPTSQASSLLTTKTFNSQTNTRNGNSVIEKEQPPVPWMEIVYKKAWCTRVM